MSERWDVAVVGAGAAGLMAAIWAGRGGCRRVIALDGAKKLGAKILVAGGGRCNVTHDVVDEQAFAGSSKNSIRKILRRFDVDRTVAFFDELGVGLKREENGKLFPVTDAAATVLDALLEASRAAGVVLRHPARVVRGSRDAAGFVVGGDWGEIAADRLVLATGGKSLPRSGSDGHGYVLARGFGHTVTPRVLPALVPLLLADGCLLRELSGLSAPATLEVRSGTGCLHSTATRFLVRTRVRARQQPGQDEDRLSRPAGVQ